MSKYAEMELERIKKLEQNYDYDRYPEGLGYGIVLDNGDIVELIIKNKDAFNKFLDLQKEVREIGEIAFYDYNKNIDLNNKDKMTIKNAILNLFK
jgi:hypothetical protein